MMQMFTQSLLVPVMLSSINLLDDPLRHWRKDQLQPGLQMIMFELHLYFPRPLAFSIAFHYKKRHIRDILGRTIFFPIMLMTLL